MKNAFLLRSLIVVAGLSIFQGCSSTGRYQINIGNGNQTLPVVRDVEVSLDGDRLKSFPVIAPQKIAATKPRSGSLPEVITVSWVSPTGESQSSEVKLTDVVPSDFKGQLVVQINPDNTLLLSQEGSRSEDLSPIPWNAPEAWEGSVLIPGFNE